MVFPVTIFYIFAKLDPSLYLVAITTHLNLVFLRKR